MTIRTRYSPEWQDVEDVCREIQKDHERAEILFIQPATWRSRPIPDSTATETEVMRWLIVYVTHSEDPPPEYGYTKGYANPAPYSVFGG